MNFTKTCIIIRNILNIIAFFCIVALVFFEISYNFIASAITAGVLVILAIGLYFTDNYLKNKFSAICHIIWVIMYSYIVFINVIHLNLY